MSLRVAFTLIGGKNWTGGYNYLLNLLRVVQRETPNQITPVLLAGTDVPESELSPFSKINECEILQSSLFNENRRSLLLVRGILFGRDRGVGSLLTSLRIDVVFESAIFLGWRLGLPAIAWLPDLQHRFFPNLFPRFGWLKREIGFRCQILSGRSVMVSSEDSKIACQHFYPKAIRRIHAVRFAVQPPQPYEDIAARRVAESYGLPDRYFFMPNQFWGHKNHMLVLEALRLLHERGQRFTVVATGKQLDPRNPEYAPSLLMAVREAGLSDYFLMPGMIPYEDLLPLMQASDALLNPSLFEGWSTTVEEARAAGVPMILSDIAVHREQAGDQATFFDPVSADSLVQALTNFEPPSLDKRREQLNAARVCANNRVNRYANEFLNLVRATVNLS